MIIRGKGMGEVGESKGGLMVMEGDLTWGEHTMQHTNDRS